MYVQTPVLLAHYGLSRGLHTTNSMEYAHKNDHRDNFVDVLEYTYIMAWLFKETSSTLRLKCILMSTFSSC